MSSWRRILALFALASFIEVVAYGQLGAFTPLYLPRLGVADADVPRWIGALAAVANLFGVAFLPFWGVFADRYGRKPLIIRSFAATGVGLAIASRAANVWGFAAGRVFTALNLGNSGLMMTTLAESAPAARLGFSYGVLNGAGPLGALIGPLVGGPLVDRFGFAAVLTLDAALLLGVVLILAVGYRDAFVARPPTPIVSSALGGIALLWRSPRLRVLFPAFLLVFAGWMTIFIYTPIVVTHITTATDVATAIGLVLGAGGLVTLVTSPTIGALADRMGIVRTYFVVGVASSLAWLLPWGAREYLPFLVTWAIANGVGSGLFSLSFNILNSSTSPETRARVMTFSYLPVNLGFVAGPALGAFIASADPFAIFPMAVILELAGLGLVALALRRPVEAQRVPN